MQGGGLYARSKKQPLYVDVDDCHTRLDYFTH